MVNITIKRTKKKIDTDMHMPFEIEFNNKHTSTNLKITHPTHCLGQGEGYNRGTSTLPQTVVRLKSTGPSRGCHPSPLTPRATAVL